MSASASGNLLFPLRACAVHHLHRASSPEVVRLRVHPPNNIMLVLPLLVLWHLDLAAPGSMDPGPAPDVYAQTILYPCSHSTRQAPTLRIGVPRSACHAGVRARFGAHAHLRCLLKLLLPPHATHSS